MLEDLALLEVVETVVTQPVGSLLHRDCCYICWSLRPADHFPLGFSKCFEHGWRSSRCSSVNAFLLFFNIFNTVHCEELCAHTTDDRTSRGWK